MAIIDPRGYSRHHGAGTNPRRPSHSGDPARNTARHDIAAAREGTTTVRQGWTRGDLLLSVQGHVLEHLFHEERELYELLDCLGRERAPGKNR